jgi:hypothetical protein
MFEKPATDMVIRSSAVVTSLGLLKGAVIRRMDAVNWEQIGGRVRTKEGEYYTWDRDALPELMVVAIREPKRFLSVEQGEGSVPIR